jgi:hypothetical protein
MGRVPHSFSLFPYSQGYDIKKNEFLNLTKGSHNVMAYVNAFNTLSQYAPEEVATDAKK